MEYEAPLLRNFGSFAELTRGAGGSAPDGGSTVSQLGALLDGLPTAELLSGRADGLSGGIG